MSFISSTICALPFDDGLVLLDAPGNRLLAYNSSAALVWTALANGASPAGALADAYGISPAQAERDAAAIIAHWRDEGLIPGTAPALAQTAVAAFLPVEGPQIRTLYAVGGHVFVIATTQAPIAAMLDGVLGQQRVAAGDGDTLLEVQAAPDGELALLVDGLERLRSRDLGEICGAVFQAILDIHYDAPDWLAILHGAAVIGGNGALVLAGPSGSGKSTLAAWLTTIGFAYAADDMAAVLAQGGRLAPWPVARSVKRGSWAVLRDNFPELDTAPGGRKGDTDLKFLPVPANAWTQPPRPVRALLFVHYEAGAACEMTALAPLDALQRLLRDRLWIGYPLRPDAVKRFPAWLDEIPAYAIRYGDLREAGIHVRTHFG